MAFIDEPERRLDMSDIADRIAHALKRRPIRVLEAVLSLAAVLGFALGPEVQEHILALAALLIVGGEVAQTRTTPSADPRDADGTPLVRAEPGGGGETPDPAYQSN